MTFAAIFDLDGTLVDSYDAHIVAWQRMSALHGVPISLEQFQRYFGRRNHQLVSEVWREAGRGALTDAEIHRIGHEKEAIYRDLVAESFPVMDGGQELLVALDAAGWLLAVASSAPIENVDRAIEGLDSRQLFDAVVTGDDVNRGKPDPECFLTAAARLGVPANQCVVVEDAPAGITAALAAGMRCVALTSKGHFKESQCDAHLVVASLRELTPERMAALVS